MAVPRPRETLTLDQAARDALGGSYEELADGTTHYQLRGAAGGQTVVMLHGGTVPLWTWELQVPALVAAGFRVLCYDMFGRGYSDRPALTYDRALYRRQLGQLLDALGLALPVDLVGTSFGGAVAVDFAQHTPDRVRRIALIAPVVHSVNNPLLAPLRLPGLGELLMRTVVAPKLAARAAEFFAHTATPEVYLRRYTEQMTYRGFARSLLSMVRSDALGDFRDAYRVVGAQHRPVQLIWGSADTEITSAAIADARAALGAVDYHQLDGAGHGAVVEQPDRINDLLVEFLSD